MKTKLTKPNKDSTVISNNRPALRLIVCSPSDELPREAKEPGIYTNNLAAKKLCGSLLKNLNQLAACIESDLTTISKL